MDIIDDAAVATEELIGAAIQKVRRALSAGPAALVCDECGDAIPEARRRVLPGCRMCVECQWQVERGRRSLARA